MQRAIQCNASTSPQDYRVFLHVLCTFWWNVNSVELCCRNRIFVNQICFSPNRHVNVQPADTCCVISVNSNVIFLSWARWLNESLIQKSRKIYGEGVELVRDKAKTSVSMPCEDSFNLEYADFLYHCIFFCCRRLAGCRCGASKSPIIQSSSHSHYHCGLNLICVAFEVLWNGFRQAFFRHHCHEWHTTRSSHSHDVFQCAFSGNVNAVAFFVHLHRRWNINHLNEME